MKTVLGIDLGTTTTEAAIINDNKHIMIVTPAGKTIVPSVVGIDDDGNWIVGDRAAAQLLTLPENTVVEAKRLMGTDESLVIAGKSYTPIEISAKILAHIKLLAENMMKEEIDSAVISVPAYFDEIQRQCTVAAGTLAGFTVERIINEPTAAAMSYGLEHMDEEAHILVYDLGGGTFDVTLLEMFEGVLEVKASSGDNALGGKDFDKKLIDHIVSDFKKKTGIELEKDLTAMVRIRSEAIKCKEWLSENESYKVSIPFICNKNDKSYSVECFITREDFNDLCGDLVGRTHEPIDTVLADSGISPDQIDKIILVGGSTRMPMIPRDIEDYLGIKPEIAVDPELAVAQGAAILGGIIGGSVKGDDALIITDVNPYTLGIRAGNGFDFEHMSVVIKRNVTIPVTKTETYTTSWDGQTEAKIEIYQGESSLASSNHFLGEFRIRGIPKAPMGREKLKVSFSYNQNGMLDVKAIIVSTGREASISVNMHEASKDAKKDRKPAASGEKWKDSPIAKKYRTIIRRAEKYLSSSDADNDPVLKALLKASLQDLKESIAANDTVGADSARDRILLNI